MASKVGGLAADLIRAAGPGKQRTGHTAKTNPDDAEIQPEKAKITTAWGRGPNRAMQPRRTWRHAALAGLVLLTGLGTTSLVASAVARCDSSPPSLLGLRLGMTPDMLRARFAGATFRTELGEDVALIADAPIAPGVAPGARFEFHDGQLVAVRARLASEHADAGGDRLVVTPGTVLARTASGAATDAVLLARTCPTHRGEAERLVSGATDTSPSFPFTGGTPEPSESSGLP